MPHEPTTENLIAHILAMPSTLEVTLIPGVVCDQILDEFLSASRLCHWCAQSYCMLHREAHWNYCSVRCNNQSRAAHGLPPKEYS